MPVGSTKQRNAKQTHLQVASRLLLMFLAVLVLISSVPQVGAVTQAEINALKQKQSEIASNKRSLQDKLASVKDEKANAIKKKHLLEEQINVILQDLSVTNNLIAQYNQQIAQKSKELEEAKAEEARYFALFCDRVRAMEEEGNVSYWAVLFNSTDFPDLLDRINMISEVMDHDNRMVDALAAARAAVATAKEQLETARSEQKTEKKNLESSRAELKKQQAAVDALVAQIRAKESEYQDQFNALAEDSVDLSNEIAAAERQYAAELEAAREAQESGTLSGTGGFIWPVPGYTRVSSKYGNRIHPISGKPSFHGGIDIPARSGTKIVASKSGIVVVGTYNSSYGNYIVLAHPDGTKTLYAHMRARAASVGSTVTQGSTIGYVGTTGSSTGNHLHFETWKGSSSSSRVNPMSFF